MFGLGHGPELIFILVIALLVFGPKKLPEMGSSIGKSIKEFKKGMSELTSHKEEEVQTPSPASYEAIEREHTSTPTVTQETTHTEVQNTEVRVDK